jgi:Ca2+-binding EF-hand superfamily protein
MSHKKNNNSSSPPKNRSSSTHNIGHGHGNVNSAKNLDPLNLLGNKRGGSSNKGRSASVLFPSNQQTRARSPSPSAARAGSPLPEDRVKKNAKGGVLITPEEIQNAFSILDMEKTGQLNIATLKKRLGLLFPEMTAKEYRFLMNNKKEITIEDLKELLLDNELAHFDPVADAFKVFDPEGKGVLNEDKLRQAFISFGLGELSDEELDILKRVRTSLIASFSSIDFFSVS